MLAKVLHESTMLDNYTKNIFRKGLSKKSCFIKNNRKYFQFRYPDLLIRQFTSNKDRLTDYVLCSLFRKLFIEHSFQKVIHLDYK